MKISANKPKRASRPAGAGAKAKKNAAACAAASGRLERDFRADQTRRHFKTDFSGGGFTRALTLYLLYPRRGSDSAFFDYKAVTIRLQPPGKNDRTVTTPFPSQPLPFSSKSLALTVILPSVRKPSAHRRGDGGAKMAVHFRIKIPFFRHSYKGAAEKGGSPTSIRQLI